MSPKRFAAPLVGLLALAAHLVAPHLHALQTVAAPVPIADEHRIARPAAAGEARTADADHHHHDGTSCPVCRALSHAGAALDAPAVAVVSVSSRAHAVLLAGAPRAPDLSARSSRSPPAAA